MNSGVYPEDCFEMYSWEYRALCVKCELISSCLLSWSVECGGCLR